MSSSAIAAPAQRHNTSPRSSIAVSRQNIHRPNGPTNRELGGDSKIVGVVKLDVGSTILGRNEDLQSIFVKGTNFYFKTESVEINLA
jgi:hypothetical protein